MNLTRLTEPSSLPVSLEEAKRHCRVEFSDDDLEIKALMQAATDYLDGPNGVLGRAIVSQEWALDLPAWPEDFMLPVEPVSGVAITYWDEAGVERELAADSFNLASWPSNRTLFSWSNGFQKPLLDISRANPVRLVITAGFGGPDAVPSGLKVAISMLVAHWYLNREAVAKGSSMAELPLAVSALLSRWRVHL